MRTMASGGSPQVALGAVSDRTRWYEAVVRQATLQAIVVLGLVGPVTTTSAETARSPVDTNVHPNADVRVVWIREDRVVLIARQRRHGLRIGERIEFHRGGFAFATGVITAVPDSGLAIASSGGPPSMADEAGIMVRRSTQPRLPRMRIGIAAPQRAHPFVPCTVQVLGTAAPIYGGARTLDRITTSFARDTTVVSDSKWPDTLVVRRYEDAADQEIALERGKSTSPSFRRANPQRACARADRGNTAPRCSSAASSLR